ncbi:translation initiation factor IF-2 [Eubacterium minutum ATCC 700079]|nr:translation initiation factor IF-2 [Eubacterium minutum ATCC 700079]
MKKKVYELAKEMGVRSKDLIARAGALGIEVKSHMSSLTDEEIGKIRDGGTPETGKAKTGKGGSSQTNSGAAGKETAAALRGKETGAGKEPEKRVSKTGRKVPVGTPIINESFLASKPKPPVGKPIVDESLFAKRDKVGAEKSGSAASVKTDTAAETVNSGKTGTAANAATSTESDTAAGTATSGKAGATKKVAASAKADAATKTAASAKTGTATKTATSAKTGTATKTATSAKTGTATKTATSAKTGTATKAAASADADSAKTKATASAKTSNAKKAATSVGTDTDAETGIGAKTAGSRSDKDEKGKSRSGAGSGTVSGEGSSAVKKLDSENRRMPRIKIVAKAEEVLQEEKARKAARAENARKRAERADRGKDGRRAGTERRSERGDRAGRKDRNATGARDGENRARRADRGGAGDRDKGFARGGSRDGVRGRRARSAGGGTTAASNTESRGGKSRRDDRRSHGKREEHNKFSKFERKSLEKKERKKYVKPKQDVVEEVVEEILPEGTFKIDLPITVAGFCEQTEISKSTVIMSLMKLGIMANINQNIDEETMMVLAEELGITVIAGSVEEEVVEEGIESFVDREKDLKDRPPIITVMGHVDHGKTSLLDAIRSTDVTKSESGGITQHIGASEVSINGRRIVFLDTPGHEAFTAMRARGAHVTDIAVLVVAADDSVKPQTIESISHAKAAGVPIIVAINKMDKPGANPDRVKKDLADNDVLVEDWGGEVISVPVSAKTGDGITNLLEMILLQAEVMELKANPNRLALGSIIEARLDKAKGPVASLLVLNGTLQAGQSIVAGTCSGRIRLMTDYRGETIKKAGPATAVEILGLTDVPQAGDEFNAVKDDKTAREIAGNRQEKLREEVMAKNSGMTFDKLFSKIQEGDVKELNVIIKGDVQGSVGAIISSLEKLNDDSAKVNVVHSGVGTVTESDIMLAETSNAVIIGFNVRPSTAITSVADRHGVEIRLYRVIYDVINDIEAAIKGMLDPEFKEEVLGKAEIRDTFKVPGVGIIGGAYVTEGKIVRNESIRLVRDGVVIHEGKVSSLKRFKDDAKEVAQGYECGIGIDGYNDIKEEDVIECFTMVEI